MTKADQIRLQGWRFKVLQRAAATGNVARTCRHFGLSRKSFYKWKGRFDAHGQAGLGDRARPPHRSPRSTPPDVVSKILYLRQRYHFGPGKIAGYLQRFHAVKIAAASVHRLLQKHGMNRLPAQSEAPTPPEALAALRETPTGASASAGRQVPGTNRRHAEAAVSVHRH